MRYTLTSDEARRFWAKVDKSGNCWMWTASTGRKGYGLFKVGRSNAGSHRISYSLTYGEIPAGSLVLHTCDVPGCVNPEHLYTGDHSDNMSDRQRRGRVARGTALPNAKLTAARVKQIRREYSELPRGPGGYVRRGLLAKLAASYGVTVGTIRAVIDGATWSWVK